MNAPLMHPSELDATTADILRLSEPGGGQLDLSAWELIKELPTASEDTTLYAYRHINSGEIVITGEEKQKFHPVIPGLLGQPEQVPIQPPVLAERLDPNAYKGGCH
jgi:hypothetical protein